LTVVIPLKGGEDQIGNPPRLRVKIAYPSMTLGDTRVSDPYEREGQTNNPPELRFYGRKTRIEVQK